MTVFRTGSVRINSAIDATSELWFGGEVQVGVGQAL